LLAIDGWCNSTIEAPDITAALARFNAGDWLPDNEDYSYEVELIDGELPPLGPDGC
jgi:hypothetical protein